MISIKEGFHTINPLLNSEGKNNFIECSIIERDGNIRKIVRLSVFSKALREEIICKHFLRTYVKFFVKEDVGIKILKRDLPWDFYIELSTKERLLIEITSISDNQIRSLNYEERFNHVSNIENIEFHELIKLDFNFPNKNIAELIKRMKEKGIKNNDIIKNPYYSPSAPILFFNPNPVYPFEIDMLIKDIVNKKLSKNHSNKDDLILIIDNRILIYKEDEILDIINQNQSYFDSLPFKEIWLYTGYFSDIYGNKAEYILCPIKISNSKLELLQQ